MLSDPLPFIKRSQKWLQYINGGIDPGDPGTKVEERYWYEYSFSSSTGRLYFEHDLYQQQLTQFVQGLQDKRYEVLQPGAAYFG